jgi:hypothetical protein
MLIARLRVATKRGNGALEFADRRVLAKRAVTTTEKRVTLRIAALY